MYKLDKGAYRRYFFYGDGNPVETLEGIMFFTWQDMGTTKDMTEEEIKDKFVTSVNSLYQQYYRFVELNSKSKIYNFYTQGNEEELKQRICNKIEELRNTDEIVTEEEIQRKIGEEAKRREKIYREHEWEWDNGRKEYWRKGTEKIAKEIRETLEKRRTKKLIIRNQEISYSIIQRYKYAHYPEGSMTKEEHKSKQQYVEYNRNAWLQEKEKIQNHENNQSQYVSHILRHWTEDVYDILKFLRETEQKDKKAYIDLWLRTRKNRAKNNTIEGIEEVEVRRINHACERIREIRLEEQKEFLEIE